MSDSKDNANREYSINIDDIPVRIRIISAEQRYLHTLVRKLEQEEKNAYNKANTTTIVQENSLPNIDTGQKIKEIGLEIISLSGKGKNWLQSRTIWTNVTAIIAVIAARFGFDIDPNAEFFMMLPAIIALVNIYLRNITKEPINVKKK